MRQTSSVDLNAQDLWPYTTVALTKNQYGGDHHVLVRQSIVI
jgi:hypothetical protein